MFNLKSLFFPRYDIQIGRVYHFKIRNLAFGPLRRETLHSIFRDGRACSKLVENCLTQWFPELKMASSSNSTGFDHHWGSRKVELKSFTKSGCNFLPSYMVGSGRTADPEKASEELTADLLCISDITEFPKISVRFVDHVWAYKKYPKGKIKAKEGADFFKKTQDEA